MSKTANIKSVPEQTVEPLPRRRSFTAEYKLRILAEADAAVEPGQIGAILRREGLYSSHLVEWRRRRAQGGIDGLTPRKAGRPPKNPNERTNDKELDRLRRENARLLDRLRRSEIIAGVLSPRLFLAGSVPQLAALPLRAARGANPDCDPADLTSLKFTVLGAASSPRVAVYTALELWCVSSS